jgi:hypothetical protein
MAQLAQLVLNNGTSDVTFTPASKDGNTIVWTASASSVQLQPRIVADAKSITTSSANRRVKYTFAMPFVDTSLNDTKSYETGYINVDVNVPKNTATSVITQLRNIALSALQNAILVDQIDNANNPY